jgi:hypothetical protein
MSNENKKYQKTIVIPIELEMWKSLRKISFEKEVSMSQLARTSLEKVIKKFQKDVDSEL